MPPRLAAPRRSALVLVGLALGGCAGSRAPAEGPAPAAAPAPAGSSAQPAANTGEPAVRGLLIDQAGFPRAGGVVRGEGPAGAVEVTSDERGRFAFTGLPPGAYRLSAAAGGAPARELEVHAAGTQLVVLIAPVAPEELDPRARPLADRYAADRDLSRKLDPRLASALWDALEERPGAPGLDTPVQFLLSLTGDVAELEQVGFRVTVRPRRHPDHGITLTGGEIELGRVLAIAAFDHVRKLEAGGNYQPEAAAAPPARAARAGRGD